jgi:PAS domain S-box-containing protein
MSNTNDKLYFLAGGGEMGELIRAKDWSKTPLGAPDTWPQSLQTMVSVVLNNPFGMYIAWGKEYVQIYNDGYRPILGNTKHPYALGASTRQTFSEIWHIIESMFDGVMEGKPVGFPDFMLPLDRKGDGTIEDCYFDFAYSPIYTDNGEVGGVLVTVIETTSKKTAQEELKESNKRYLNNIIQAPVAMCIFRGKNHIVEIANEHMLQLWGTTAENVLDKPIFVGLPEAKDQGLELLIDTVFITGEKFTANERPVQLPRNGKVETRYLNFIYEALKEIDGTTSGIIAIASDVTDQVLSRSKIEENEHKVRALVDNAPFAIAVYSGEDMIIEIANETIINIWGKGKNVIGKSYKDILPELQNQLIFDQIKTVFQTGEAFYKENTPIDLIVDGKLSTYYFNYSFTPLYDLNGNIYAVMNTGVDLTDLNLAKKKVEEADRRFRNTVKQAPVAMTILRSPEYIVEMVNDAYLKLVDREESAILGKPLFDYMPEVKETISSLLDGVYTTGNPYHGNELPVPINRFGTIEIIYFDFLYYPLKEISGEITGIIVTATNVSEKVEARKKIEQNEERLNIIVEASELGTWEVNLKTSELQYSQRFLEIIGGYTNNIRLTHEQLINHIHPDDRWIRDKAYKKSLTTGNLQYEVKSIWADQSIHWVEGKGKVFYDKEGTAEKMLGTVRDSTDIKKRQQELEESEQKFRLLSNSMPQHVWTSDPEGNLNYFNQYIYDYSGLTPYQIAKDGWIQIVHPDDADENIRAWQDSIATGNDFLLEHRFRRHDGEYRWQLSRAIPQIDENGNISMWVGTSTDIQDQKNFANELEKKVIERTKEISLINESLEKSEERYHLMVEEIQDYAILYLNHLGIVENWNLGSQKIKGYKAEEIVGKSFSIFYTESDKKNNLPQNLLKEAEEKGRARHEGWRVRNDGSLFWANVLITAIHNKKKELIGFSKVTHDLTEKKKADDKIKMNALELQQKNVELESMNKELQSFAYISSHDLQEPLRKIQTFASQILDKESQNLSDTGKEKFKRMQYAAQRMQALINDLLAYSKANIQDVKFERTNLSLLIHEVKNDLIEEQDQQQMVFIDDEVCEDIMVDIIPFQFRQILYNLLSNSIKFSRKDIPLTIEIKCKIDKGNAFENKTLLQTRDYCHLQISDNGIGFEQEYGEKIFEVFQRLHGKTEYVGTGIGLAIVKKIVDNHNGIITATGEKNKGASFDIFIPIA